MEVDWDIFFGRIILTSIEQAVLAEKETMPYKLVSFYYCPSHSGSLLLSLPHNKKAADGDHPHQQPYMKQARQFPLFFKICFADKYFHCCVPHSVITRITCRVPCSLARASSCPVLEKIGKPVHTIVIRCCSQPRSPCRFSQSAGTFSHIAG